MDTGTATHNLAADSRFRLDLAPPGELLVECARVPRRASPLGALRIACLGKITVDHLLDAAAAEVAVVLLDRGLCPDCPAAARARPWIATLAAAQTRLIGAGLGAGQLPEAETRPLPPGTAAHHARF